MTAVNDALPGEPPAAGAGELRAGRGALRRSVLHVAGLIAMLTLLSKGFGFGRELVIADVFGAGMAKDAFTYAYVLPAFALVMLGGLNGPFHTSALTALTRMKAQGQEDECGGVIATLFVGTALFMGLLAGLVYLAAPLLVHTILAPAAPAPVAHLTVMELRIMAPVLLFGGLNGLLCGVANAREQFSVPSLSPMVTSSSVIAAVLIFRTPVAMALGTFIGAMGQLALQAVPLILTSKSCRLPKPVPLGHPAIRETVHLLLPAVLTSSIGTINVNIGLAFASTLAVGGTSVFDYANKLLQLPLGILLTALLVPLLPAMTRAVADQDRRMLHVWMNRGIQTVAIATFPMTVGAIVLGYPLIRFFFLRGAFTTQAAQLTYLVLAFSAMSLTAYAWRDLLTRVFYAMNDSRRPLIVGIASIAFNLLFNFLLVRRFGVVGLASAYSLVTVANMTLMAWLLRRQLGTLGLGPSLSTVLKCAVAAVSAGAVVYLANHGIHFWATAHGLRFFLRVSALGTLLLALYGAVLVAWRVPLVEYVGRRSPLGAS